MDGDLTRHDAEVAEKAAEQARLLKVLGNPWRLRIVQLLLREPMQVGDLENALGLGQAYVSQQLARLRSENIVEGDRNGRSVSYRVVDARVADVLQAINRQ